VAIGSGLNTRAECRRIADYAFEYALKPGSQNQAVSSRSFRCSLPR
jgi:isocitrate/isopropylmalate dehydrogenase